MAGGTPYFWRGQSLFLEGAVLMLNVPRQPVRLKPNLQVHGVGPADITFLQFRLVEVQCSVLWQDSCKDHIQIN